MPYYFFSSQVVTSVPSLRMERGMFHIEIKFKKFCDSLLTLNIILGGGGKFAPHHPKYVVKIPRLRKD